MWSLGYSQVPESDEQESRSDLKQEILPLIPKASPEKDKSKNMNSDSDSESLQDEESSQQDTDKPSEETDNSTNNNSKTVEVEDDFVIVDPNSLNESNKLNDNLALKPSNLKIKKNSNKSIF